MIALVYMRTSGDKAEKLKARRFMMKNLLNSGGGQSVVDDFHRQLLGTAQRDDGKLWVSKKKNLLCCVTYTSTLTYWETLRCVPGVHKFLVIW